MRIKKLIWLLALPYVVNTSSGIIDCWETNPNSHLICLSYFINADGESYGNHSVFISMDGVAMREFSTSFSTSNVKDFQEKREEYLDMADALNEARQRRTEVDCQAQYVQCGNDQLKRITDKFGTRGEDPGCVEVSK